MLFVESPISLKKKGLNKHIFPSICTAANSEKNRSLSEPLKNNGIQQSHFSSFSDCFLILCGIYEVGLCEMQAIKPLHICTSKGWVGFRKWC